METVNWVSQPNVCRCCLAANGTWDLSAYCSMDTGNNEALTDVLQKCFGINLSCMMEFGASKLVCGTCLDHIWDTNAFRKQVLKADKQFLEYYRGLENPSLQVKDNEILQENVLADSPTYMYDDDKQEEEIIVQPEIILPSRRHSPRNRQGKKRNVNAKRKREKIASENCDSDKTMEQLPNKNYFLHKANENFNDNNCSIGNGDGLESNLNDADIKKIEISSEGPQQIKKISESKRLVLTCAIVLKNTNACPFRHHTSWFRCFFCTEDFIELNLLREHMLKKHAKIDEALKKVKRYPRSLQIDITELKCRLCDTSLTDVDAMIRHFDTVHEKIIYKESIADYKVNASPYTCHLCQKEFHVFRTLTTHLNEHYANCICDVCGKSFLNSKRLKVHKQTHEDGNYPCLECGKVLKTKTSKANHMEIAHSKRVMKCQICSKTMKNYNDRLKHMSEAHNITNKFKCTLCSKEYNIKHYLATHIRQTHGSKNKKCTECSMAFITNHGLKKHMMKHSGEKPYTCSVCSKSYTRNYALMVHMKGHNVDKKT